MKSKPFRGKVYGRKHTEESFSYPYKNIRRIVCTCGYEGVCIQETCKKCRQKASVHIEEATFKTRNPIYSELTGFTKGVDTIEATLIVRKVFQNLNQYHLVQTNKIFLEFHTNSGETFANGENITYQRVEKNPEENFTMFSETRQIQHEWLLDGAFHMFPRGAAYNLFQLLPVYNGFEPKEKENATKNKDNAAIYLDLIDNKEILNDFFTLCAKERNLHYTDVPHLLRAKDGLDKMIALLRLPVLEYVEELKINVLSEEIATRLAVAKNGKDVWKILIGHTGKEIKKHALTDVNYLNHLMRWGSFIQKQENLVKLAASFRFEKDHREIFLLGGWEHLHSKLFDTMDEKQAKFRAGMRVIANTHPNETVWVNRILQFKNTTSETPKSEEEVYRYICDIGDMHTQIINEFPDFTLKRKNSIKAIHNELVAWFRKVKVPNVTLPITEKMKTLEADGFVFAKSSHELVDVGVEMDICVGSYWSRVYNGYCSIVLLKEKNEPKVCIELDPQFSIVQAKMYKNNLPSKRYQEKIKAWAKKHQLMVHTHDLNENFTATYPGAIHRPVFNLA